MKKRFYNFMYICLAALIGAGAVAHTVPAAAQTETAVAAPLARMQGFEDLAEKLVPAVVNISTTVKIERPQRGPMPQMPALPPGSPFEEFFKDFYDQQQSGPRPDEKASSLGSGFVIDAANGYIVTNNHVIRDAEEIKVILTDNTTMDATLVGTDDKTDIALLKVKPTKPLTQATWGDSDKARVGSWILAIGNPFGLGGTVTAGIISARHRDINSGPYDEYIQTDASINRGNSGGPMFNTQGEVVGVNTAIFSPSGGSVGIGFAVPSNLAKNVVEQLIKYGKTKRGWLGVRIQEVTPEIAENLKLDQARGALVAGITEKGPAEKAGVKPGDVILKFDGRDIADVRQLPKIVAEQEVGKKSSVTVWRKGKEETLTVDLGQLEKAEESGLIASPTQKQTGKSAVTTTALDSLGLTLAPINEAARETYKLSNTLKGVLITDVKRDSIAAEKDLMAGDVIAEVDQQEVTTPAQVVEKVTAAEKANRSSVLLFVARREDMRFVALKFKK